MVIKNARLQQGGQLDATQIYNSTLTIESMELNDVLRVIFELLLYFLSRLNLLESVLNEEVLDQLYNSALSN